MTGILIVVADSVETYLSAHVNYAQRTDSGNSGIVIVIVIVIIFM